MAKHVAIELLCPRNLGLLIGVGLALLVLPVVSGCSREALAKEVSETVVPSRSDVASLVERQARSWETGDEKEFLDTLHPEAVFAYPGKRLTREDALKTFRDWKRDFTDTKLRVHRLIVDGRHFSVEYMFASTNRSTGKRMAAGTVALGDVKEGKLHVWKEYLDGRVSRGQAKDELPVDELAEPYPWPDTPESRKP
ncbi:MAG TPA: nuclear transport factor 2 family protein [Opitutaceae bacterium]|nr:nuclear transport factor 2 family protein [Opitutaceae bacterium]